MKQKQINTNKNTNIKKKTNLIFFLLETNQTSNSNSSNEKNKSDDCLKENECAICISDIENNDILRTLPCFHKYHKECIDPYLIERSLLCPICKNSIQKNEIKLN